MLASALAPVLTAAALAATALQGTAAPDTPDPADLAEMRTVALDRLFTYWPDYLDLPEDARDGFNMVHRIDGPEGWRLWLEAPNGEISALAAYPDETLTPPPLALFETGEVRVEAPPGSMSVTMELRPAAPLGERYDAAALRAGAGQANRAMREVAGVAALFAPRMQAVVFTFDGPAPEAWAVSADGEREALPVSGETATLPLRRREFRDAEAVEFGRAPISARFDG